MMRSLQTTQRRSVTDAPRYYERMADWTIELQTHYRDPFNDVEIDVIFSAGNRSWRVPMFWRGGNKWTVRFAPPAPGRYDYFLESTDADNPEFHNHSGQVVIGAYAGHNPLLQRGALRLSSNRRHFEHADGTPFYWLADTWWMGLSDRLPWEGFKELAADRNDKGFTVVQLVAGLVPHEEVCPVDPGCHNEGGAVWDPEFQRINPHFFDYADRRIEHLVDAGMVPAIVGAWKHVLDQMGTARMKKHWRYIIGRYGAYPVFWIVGGEVFDPPEAGGWTEVARYVRAVDPYRHPISVHEVSPDALPLHDESLTDFHLFQPSHFGWRSIAVEIAQLSAHYSRSSVTKPLVVGEIGYEMLAKTHLEDFQRVAFWLGVLNGAAGHSYGASGTFESYTADKPLHRRRWSFLTWREGMSLPGSYQVGLGAKFLRQYQWWRFAPHPEWVSPRGTTLFESRASDELNRFQMNLAGEWGDWDKSGRQVVPSEWTERNGNFRLPYAAGIPNEVRFIYIPSFDLIAAAPPTVQGLEPGIRYRACYWEPSLGIKIDLGCIERPQPREPLKRHTRAAIDNEWSTHELGAKPETGEAIVAARTVRLDDSIEAADVEISVSAESAADIALVLRFMNADNFLLAVYSAHRSSIFLLERKDGIYGLPLGETSVTALPLAVELAAEVRGGMAIVSLRTGEKNYNTPIVPVSNRSAGRVGLMQGPNKASAIDLFEIRPSAALASDQHREKNLYDAEGIYRGHLSGPGLENQWIPTVAWDEYAAHKHILLDAYRPELPPTSGDWLLVLAAEH